MARDFSKAFYSSKEWKEVRDYCIIRDHHECVKCGNPAEEVHHIIHLTPFNINDTSITLNPDNLVCLCRDCHFDIHREYRQESVKRANKRLKHKRIVREDGTFFDEQGMLQQRKVYIVYGCPRSGKSTYVKNHMEYGDIVIDVDNIISALQYSDDRHIDNNIQFLALDIRDYLFKELENKNKNFDCKHVWIIGGFPDKKQRNDLADKLKAELIFIKVTYQDAIERAVKDDLYGDKQYSKDIINAWFRKFQP